VCVRVRAHVCWCVFLYVCVGWASFRRQDCRKQWGAFAAAWQGWPLSALNTNSMWGFGCLTLINILQHLSRNTIWDVEGGGREPRKQKDFCTTLKKRQTPKIPCPSDAGICYSITGTRFPYYITWWACGNGTLLVQIKPKKEFETQKVMHGYRPSGYTPALHVSAIWWGCLVVIHWFLMLNQMMIAQNLQLIRNEVWMMYHKLRTYSWHRRISIRYRWVSVIKNVRMCTQYGWFVDNRRW